VFASCARWMESFASYPSSLRSILIFFYLCSGLLSALSPSGFRTKILCISYCAYHMPHPSHLWFEHPSNMWQWWQIMKFLVRLFLSSFLPLESKYFQQYVPYTPSWRNA
jgi:hypothetical protein